MGEPKLIKVCLTNQGEDTETPWAQDLGPAPNAAAGARKVKLVNVPFMHAKPTWGDTIVVTPVADSVPTWDRGGVKWNEISSLIVEDGGRWAMILDYRPQADVPAAEAFTALAQAVDAERIVCEGAWAPKAGDPGRAYLAVPKETTVEAVLDHLGAAALPMQLILVHPELKKARARTVVGVTSAQPRKPARAKTEQPTEKRIEDTAAPPKKPSASAAAAKPTASAASAKAALAKAPAAKAAPAVKASAAKAAPAPAKAPPPAAKAASTAKPAASAVKASAAKAGSTAKPAAPTVKASAAKAGSTTKPGAAAKPGSAKAPAAKVAPVAAKKAAPAPAKKPAAPTKKPAAKKR